MFDEKLQKFLNTNGACLGGITRLQDVGAETLEEAWDKASDEDLIWAVTRPGIMDVEQRRLFLVMVLSSIENKLTDPCSKNILTKLRANETITEEDRASVDAAREAAWAAAREAAWAAAREAAWDASGAAAWASGNAAGANAWAAARRAAGAAQAKYVRENFNLCDLHTN
jgi:hypothetical protein